MDIAVKITAPMGLNFIEMADEIEAFISYKDRCGACAVNETGIPAICKKGCYIFLKETLLCI